MRLERTKGSLKEGINERPWNFLYLTTKEAISLVRSLAAQIVAGTSSKDRDETILENGEWFTAFVHEDQAVKVASHVSKLDTFSAARDAIMTRIIELDGGLEHAVEGTSIDSRVEGLREAEMLVMRLQGEAVGWFEKEPKTRKKARR